MSELEKARFVRARALQSLFEGQQAEALLQEAGIPCMLVSYRDTALDGLYQPQKGWGEIRVPEEQRAEAEQVLAEQMPGAASLPEEQLADQALQAPVPKEERPPRSAFRWLAWSVLAVVALCLGYYLLTRFSR